MRTTEYLYGDLDEVVIQTSKSVAKAKRDAAKKLLTKLLSVPLKDRKEDRINAVIKAIEFNERLMDE